MENLVIREVYDSDLEEMVGLCGQLGYPTTLEAFKSHLGLVKKDKHLVLVAELLETGVVGWIHVMPRRLLVAGFYCEVGGIIVDEKHRRKGIGKALLETAEHWVLDSGCQGMIIRSNQERQASHSFYTKTGYQAMKKQEVYIKTFTSPA